MSRMLLIAVLAAALGAPCASSAEAPTAHFEGKVWPLLESRCVNCHGPDKQKGGLRVDSREALLKGGESGPAVVPGKASESLLLQAVSHSKKDLEMPPKEKLSAAEVAVLEQWVSGGAVWSRTIAASAEEEPLPSERIGDAWSDPRNPIVRIFGGKRLDLWSLKPVAKPVPPKPKGTRWVRNGIDRFILARLETEGLKPAPEADRRALVRRLYYDLTGLPPTQAEVDAFLRDKSPQAYERLADKLLASPRYGEHQARLWLDVIRYSDSNGFDWDEFRPKAWRFRDCVIRSMNEDKPFDQFILEQLAGDELVGGPPATRADQDRLLATGFLRLGPFDNAAPLFNEQDRSRTELLSDLVETTGAAFLGMSMACCRCHDHKFDPLSQADYYRMRAFFEPVKFADDLPVDLAAERDAKRAHNEALDAELTRLKGALDALTGPVRSKLREEKLAGLSAEERSLLSNKPEKPSEAQKKQIEELTKKTNPSETAVLEKLEPSQRNQAEKLKQQIVEAESTRRKPDLALLMTDSAGRPPVTRVLFQGNHKEPRQPVRAGFLSALDPNPAKLEHGASTNTTGRRLTLARWIASPENPLTTRVAVNRAWQAFFGQGLVATPNDFGLAGTPPTHPELLDWLAGEFVRQGWSMKRLHRLIVTSATYRQAAVAPAEMQARASAVDASNLLLWRQNLRRLSAEQLRDSVLAVAGSLRLVEGGPPVWPDLPPEVLQANPAFLDDNETKTKGWYPSPLADRGVRSIFLVQKRTVRIPFMEAFDLPENGTSCARRGISTVAPQALSLLNNPLTVEASQAFAARVSKSAGSSREAQVDEVFHLAFQRKPTREERRACVELLMRRSLPELCRAVINLNEFAYVD